MPIYKYQSLAEAKAHLHQLLPSDPLERLQHLTHMIAILKPPRTIQRGLFRFKTMAEANLHRKHLETRF